MHIPLRKAFFITAGVLALAPVFAAGCSSDEDNGGNGNLGNAPFCPATLALALDAKTSCVGEGFECPIGYTCGSFDQQAYCRCTKGKFVCNTGRNEPIDDATKPPCTASGAGSDKECPASQNGTDTASCKTPGLQCFYKGFTCPESPDIPKVDVCQCKSAALPDGGPSLQFHCEIRYCNPKSDASIPVPPPPADAGQG
ncbi:MAG: hypothetical protein IPG50_16680 [Myxococcales bacterium]|nr:hypothetical protein [Myxococcales bacterium]